MKSPLVNRRLCEIFTNRTVRTELVEVQSHDTSNGVDEVTNLPAPSFVRSCAALPFDRLRANGSTDFGISTKFSKIEGAYGRKYLPMMGKILMAFAILLAFTANSVAAGPIKPAKASILIFGDSLSAAFGLQPDQGWPALAAAELAKQNIVVINASVSGETTAGGLSRLPVILKRYQPNVVVIALGANDGLRGLDPNAMQRNLLSMTKLAQASKARVLIIGVRLPPNFGPEYNQLFEQSFADVAKLQRTPLLKFLLEPIAGDIDAFQADQLHPTASAQPKIWAHVRKALLPLIKK